MWRDPESGNQVKDEDEVKYSNYIRSLMYMLIVLACLRLFSLEILSMLSDGIGALMVYCYLLGRGKCMAILLIFNASMGLIMGIGRVIGIYNAGQIAGFSSYLTILLLISIYALVVYSIELYIGIIGVRKYSWENMFGTGGGVNQGYQNSYGAVPSNEQSASSTNNRRNIQAFSGRGTPVGGG
jgi:hypothetical protein